MCAGYDTGRASYWYARYCRIVPLGMLLSKSVIRGRKLTRTAVFGGASNLSQADGMLLISFVNLYKDQGSAFEMDGICGKIPYACVRLFCIGFDDQVLLFMLLELVQ